MGVEVLGTELIVLIVLILLNAFFALSEMALVSINDNKIKHMADEGHKQAIKVHKLLSEPSRFLATIQIGITLAGFLASAFAAGSYANSLVRLLVELGVDLDVATLRTISTIIITIILSYFTLVLGELVPKRLALQKAEAISFLVATPLALLAHLTSPFVKFLTISTNVIVRLFGLDPNAEDEKVTEEEIRLMVDVGQERGAIQETEKEMINNIFEFDNKVVSEIMTHRTNIAAIPIQSTMREIINVVNEEKYTRFPVYEENIDNIMGIFHIKDLFEFIEKGDIESFQLKDHIREPFFILESTRIDRVFEDMKKNKIHMAIVIDEYGGIEGILTMEDLIEEIVGNIFDEYDEHEMVLVDIEVVNNKTFIISGTTGLDVLEGVLNIEFPTEEYETISGFLIGQLGYIPSTDEQPMIGYENVLFTVEEMSERRITKIRANIIEQPIFADESHADK